MDHYVLIWSVCMYVESRVQGEVSLGDIAVHTGFSLPHVREVFRNQTGKPLVRYVQERQMAHAAQMLLHTDASVLDVALQYGYASRDVFSRTFRRLTGYTPTAFRAARLPLARVKLCAGVYGPALPKKREEQSK
ncbi:MAG: helix-turn-helix transcriptional regulator [Clostridia bacterium]|nr:helix-turn-helix transcriptional regulator [Clostridia bacterium]